MGWYVHAVTGEQVFINEQSNVTVYEVERNTRANGKYLVHRFICKYKKGPTHRLGSYAGDYVAMDVAARDLSWASKSTLMSCGECMHMINGGWTSLDDDYHETVEFLRRRARPREEHVARAEEIIENTTVSEEAGVWFIREGFKSLDANQDNSEFDAEADKFYWYARCLITDKNLELGIELLEIAEWLGHKHAAEMLRKP